VHRKAERSVVMTPANYDRIAAGGLPSTTLLAHATCPHCWEAFAPEDVLWISEHVELVGDPMLGPESPQRFLPMRYTLDGNAIDSKGMIARFMACPRCHLTVPRSVIETEPLFISILGAPASGKSYFLTAMIWELRRVLPHDFKIAFTDTDPESNRALNEREEQLFLNTSDSELFALTDLIRKTEVQGELYDSVRYGQQTVSYPRPLLFNMSPLEGHPAVGQGRLSRVLCLYDQAGEDFQPGQDTVSVAGTRHLALSRALLFLFDPTQDRRFRTACLRNDSGGESASATRLSRQETIVNEAAVRIRRYAVLSHAAKYEKPVVVVVTKLDKWSHLLDVPEPGNPWSIHGNIAGIDLEKIEQISSAVRDILARYCPEIVTAVHSFGSDVTFIAVSALGTQVEHDIGSGSPRIRPSAIRPQWVSAPILYTLSRVLPSLVPRSVGRSKRGEAV
jgi:hypothetical protein